MDAAFSIHFADLHVKFHLPGSLNLPNFSFPLVSLTPFRYYRNSALLADPTRLQQISDRIPAKRWGKPEDFAGPVTFLASEASNYVCGELLVVDGVSLVFISCPALKLFPSGLDGSLSKSRSMTYYPYSSIKFKSTEWYYFSLGLLATRRHSCSLIS